MRNFLLAIAVYKTSKHCRDRCAAQPAIARFATDAIALPVRSGRITYMNRIAFAPRPGRAIAALLALTSAFTTSAAQAIEPALIRYDASGPWSSVEYSEFDGLYVNDRHDGIGGENDRIVTQWSRTGIRATFRDYSIAGYTIVPRTHYESERYYSHHAQRWLYRRIPYTVYERVPQWTYEDRIPTAIRFAIDGEQYTYTEGPVSPELAAALASAPPGNLRIRLEFGDQMQHEVKIGAGTVRAWQRVFGEPLTPEEARELQRQQQEQEREDASEPDFNSRFGDR